MTRPIDPIEPNDAYDMGSDESDEFIEDLESIKDLLNELEQTEQVQTPVQESTQASIEESDVPLLDDQIDSNVQERLGDDTFNTLLGDAWRDSVEEMFDEARADIEANSTEWLPEHTDELADALKIRIDASVRAWLAETLQANIHLLRERIVAELSAELIGHMRDKIGNKK